MAPIAPSNKTSRPALVVQKYGGMSLATPEHLRAAAKRVATLRASGVNVIAVVSAMGSSTDKLVELAYSVSSKPNRRELDMLLSTGERVSMALFSMALTDALAELVPSARAISFTGSQAGILTDETHSNARIIDVKSIRVQEELDRGNVVILAGFQGVSPQTKEITTLGRGGTDVTAVAMAAAFQASRCEILKEVPGVLSADPRQVPNAKPLSTLSHGELLEMTFWGAKVLHYRSVELAATHNVPIVVGFAHSKTSNDSENITRVQSPSQSGEVVNTFENENVLSVTSHAEARVGRIKAGSLAQGLAKIQKSLTANNLPMPQILDLRYENALNVIFTAPVEVLENQVNAMKKDLATDCEFERVSTVTAIAKGTYSTDFVSTLAQKLDQAGVQVQSLLLGAMSATFVVTPADCSKAVQLLHSAAR